MRATAIIESGNWNGTAVNLAMPEMPDVGAQAATFFVSGYAAAQRGDLEAADTYLSTLKELIASSEPDPEYLALPGYLDIFRSDLEAVIAFKRGEVEKAFALVRAAVERLQGMAFDFGPPPSVKPPHELLGELLLDVGKPSEAVDAFTHSLELAPLRTLSLLGLARAQNAAGDADAATKTYRQLISVWHAADPDLRGLIEARSHLAANAKE
jgi:tetratricopeptide (TPR) repeat protein